MNSYRKHPCVIIGGIWNLALANIWDTAPPTRAFLSQHILIERGFTWLRIKDSTDASQMRELFEQHVWRQYACKFARKIRSPSIKSTYLLLLYDIQALHLQSIGKAKYAVQVLEQVVKIRESIVGKDHPSRLALQNELVHACEANGQIPKSVQLLESVVKIQVTTLSQDHSSQLASQYELAGVHKANEQIQKAAQLLENVVKIRETTLSDDHPDRLISQHALTGAYQANARSRRLQSH